MNNLKNKAEQAVSRRGFVKASSLALAGVTILPRHVLGGKGFIAPSDKLNVAGVGIGGMGKSNLNALAPTENIVALCDVDEKYAGPVFEKYPNAKRYKDYRKMLEAQKDIDGIVVATPDHLHGVIASAAMKLGKHVYVQKPLTVTVWESRELARLAKENPKVVTQMGNQGHSNDDARLINEWIADGAIGKVQEVHVWTNRPIWPQGMEVPKEAVDAPSTLDWELFLGPAPHRAYNPAYTPFKWRGWVDYGAGALGDMGAHLVDHPFWALGLNPPITVEASSTPFNKQSYPVSSLVTFEFETKDKKNPLTMTWYDGGILPPKPVEFGDGPVPKGGGVLYIGTKGKLFHETYGSKPRLLPQEKMDSYKKPAQTIPRVGMSHERNWAEACKGNGKAVSPFEYAGPLCETMLLGIVALYKQGTKLNWDTKTMAFTNAPELNPYLKREYRQGWAM
ncbi:Gfo/Idh/MocA family protein [Larkinella sp. C7]|jgi:predicted dehydrogenase|uniref:Gfo/Idh/MocA family protein n=1 Tax=Larkinella sp. C7 TaxID=2576607 RepID=UPI001110FE7D|nr:Gfo/Idh/MocA family oxidoreductase [Larkinella sp. C7]